MLLLSHCISGEDSLKIWIFSWHMPIFFVVCGILLQRRYSERLSFSKLKSWLKRRVMQIFIPYFIFGFLYIVFVDGLSLLDGDYFDIVDGCFSLRFILNLIKV